MRKVVFPQTQRDVCAVQHIFVELKKKRRSAGKTSKSSASSATAASLAITDFLSADECTRPPIAWFFLGLFRVNANDIN